jgi:hypothetical protein
MKDMNLEKAKKILKAVKKFLFPYYNVSSRLHIKRQKEFTIICWKATLKICLI